MHLQERTHTFVHYDVTRDSSCNFLVSVFKRMMNGCGPYRRYTQGISRPYPAPLLTLSPVTSQLPLLKSLRRNCDKIGAKL